MLALTRIHHDTKRIAGCTGLSLVEDAAFRPVAKMIVGLSKSQSAETMVGLPVRVDSKSPQASIGGTPNVTLYVRPALTRVAIRG